MDTSSGRAHSGKYGPSANVSEGKVTGMNVRHADEGCVAVTKYKTMKNMGHAATSGVEFVY